MSGKLDQSLDQIMSESKTANPRRRPRPARKAGKPAAAPTGGVKKNTKGPKADAAVKAATAALQGASKESKIVVSNLPSDVSETIIKDFFVKSIGGVKRVTLSYAANGRSRGEATVVFSKGDSAVKAVQQFNGVEVDKRPMKIEVVASAAAPTLQDRITKPKLSDKKKNEKTGPKAAGAAKGATKGTAKDQGKKGGKKAGNAGKPKRKTAEELDAEMQDYWGAPEGNATNGAANGTAPAPVPAQADAGMTDEVM